MILKTHSLTPFQKSVILASATERPFSEPCADNAFQAGSWLCRLCGHALFRQKARFEAGCGWPAFNQEIRGTVEQRHDPDGQRREIRCQRCKAHLGHVFEGEGFTPENIRHCVNSTSLDSVNSETVLDSEELILAAGCFWGVEFLFAHLPGVLKTEVGYSGGPLSHPSYEQVCSGNTGHYEAVRVLFDPGVISSEKIIQYFYEIHHPEQKNGQGPDIGSQYGSAIFVYDATQKEIAERVTTHFESINMKVATRILPVQTFWPAEHYHQKYYEKTGSRPYCHRHEKKF